jgi:hypothetical protein
MTPKIVATNLIFLLAFLAAMAGLMAAGTVASADPTVTIKPGESGAAASAGPVVDIKVGESGAAASAGPVVDIKVGESGADAWDIGPVAPGENGYQTVSIKNTGDRTANLNIWLSNITGQEGTPAEFLDGIPSAGGDLSRFLLLDLSAQGLTSSFSLPSTLDRFPTEISSVSYLFLAKIRSSQTVKLTWHWQLPAETGNDVQGDSLAFDINYTLTEIAETVPGGGGGSGRTPTPAAAITPALTPVPSTAATPVPTAVPAETAAFRLIELDMPDASSTAAVSDEGLLADTLTAATPDQVFSLTIDRGTRLSISNQDRTDSLPEQLNGLTVPDKISVAFLNSAAGPAFPGGWVRVSPFIEINGITIGLTHGIRLSVPAHMVIQYDSALLPENMDNLAAFYYSPQYGWTQLQPPAGFIAEAGETAADTSHFSLFVVLAREAVNSPKPAHFEVSRLLLDPPRIMLDQSSELRFRVANTGGLAGEYTVAVKVNDTIQKTQFIRLGAGESREIHLVLSPDINGIYTVEVSGISAQLIVDPAGQADVAETGYWWIPILAIVCAVPVLAVLYRRRQKSPEQV